MKRLLMSILLTACCSTSHATVYVLDSFTHTSAVDITSHTGEIGATWTKNSAYNGGTNQLFTQMGEVYGPNAIAAHYASGIPATADYSVEADFVKRDGTNSHLGITARASTTAGTFYLLQANSQTGNINLYRYLAGTGTLLAQYAYVLPIHELKHLKLTVVTEDANTVRLVGYLDGTSVINYADTSADRLLNIGVAGIFTAGTLGNALVGVHLDNFIVRDISAVDAITLINYTDKRVFQRAGTAGTLTVRGYYDGSPTAVQARVVQHGTSTEVTTWADVSSQIMANGFFSGTISVPQGGWYNLQVRFKNSTGVVSNSTKKVGVGAIIALAGQSNMSNWNVYTGVTANDLISRHTFAGGIVAATGNGINTFGNTVVAALNIPVLFLDYASSGSSMANWLDTAFNSLPGKLMFGAKMLGGMEAYIWQQGEYEATNGGTEATYYTNLGTLISTLRSNIGVPTLPVLIGYLPTGTASAYANIQLIRNAQIRRTADTNVYGTSLNDLAKTDIHYTPASYTESGKRLAKLYLYVNGAVSWYQGPEFLGYTVTDSTHITIRLRHISGTDFTPTSGITGFVVNDNGTPVTISTAVRTNTTTITLTLAAPLAGTATVFYLAGQNPAITSPVRDNTAITLPPQNTIDGQLPVFNPPSTGNAIWFGM